MAFHHPTAGHHRARRVIESTGHSLKGVGRHLERRHPDYAEDKKLIDHELERAFSEHDAQLHGGKKTRLKLASGGAADGAGSKSRGDRAGRGKHPDTSVNVIVAPRPAGGMPVPVPMGGGAAPPMPPRPMPMPPPGGMPPGMPVGAGPMPPRPPMGIPPGAPMGMPMRKAGGRTGYKPPRMTAGQGSGEGRREASREADYAGRDGRGRA